MNKFMPMLKLAPEDDKGGSGGAPNAEKKPDNSAGDPPAEEGGNTHDDFGYETPAEDDKTPAEEKPSVEKKPDEKKTPAAESEKVEGLAGYGEEPPDVKELPPVEEKKDDKTPPPAQDELDKAIGTDGLEAEVVSEIKAFAQKIKATPEQAKELADFRRKELADAKAWNEKQEKEYANEKLRRRAAQHQELKNDKDFGGDNFKMNLMRVDKVLAEMPHTKKILTDTKGQLPTWIMRDLAVLSKKLFGSSPLVNGEPNTTKEEKEEDNFLDEMYT